MRFARGHANSDRKRLGWTVEGGVEQTVGYMEKCGAEEGHLVVIDRRSGEPRRNGEPGRSRPHPEGGEARSRRRHEGREVVVRML